MQETLIKRILDLNDFECVNAIYLNHALFKLLDFWNNLPAIIYKISSS
jgi:hypothetical protein